VQDPLLVEQNSGRLGRWKIFNLENPIGSQHRRALPGDFRCRGAIIASWTAAKHPRELGGWSIGPCWGKRAGTGPQEHSAGVQSVAAQSRGQPPHVLEWVVQLLLPGGHSRIQRIEPSHGSGSLLQADRSSQKILL